MKAPKHTARNARAVLKTEDPMHRLHTDLLEERYGPVSIRLLRHGNKVRMVHLVDMQGVSRTFAITFLAPSCPEIFTKIDAKIRGGASIGRTFLKYGCEVRKNVLKVLTVNLPLWLRTEFAHSSLCAKAFLSEFIARIGARPPELYGTIIEIFSPDFRTPEITTADHMQEGPTLKSLMENRVPHEEIWKRLGSDTTCDRSDHRYMIAWRSCQRDILIMEERLASLLEGKESNKNGA